VLGRTLQIGTTLRYEPLDEAEIEIASDQFGEFKFSIGNLELGHWASYVQASARVLNVRRGMRVKVSGSLIGAGLS